MIREARARRRHRQLMLAAMVAAAAATGLALWAAVPGGGSRRHMGPRGSHAALTHRIELGRGRVPVVEVGSSGGVTWAINGGGMWLTTNGGRTWRASLPRHVSSMGDAVARVQQVQFLDRRHGWLLAVDVRGGVRPIWRRHAELDWTADGGRSWHWTVPRGCCGDVSFLSPRRGFFLTRSKLFSSTEGGRSWQPVARTPFRYGIPTFVDARHGVAVAAGNGRLFSTGDGGKRWVPAHIPRSEGVFANVAAFGERLVVPAVSSTASAPWRLIVYVSGDGGATWQVRPVPRRWMLRVRTSDPSEFSAASPRVWYAVGRRNLVGTTDAGRSWRLVRVDDLPPGWTISAIDFTSPRVGWAVFQLDSPPGRSVLMRTTDGGRNWTPAGPRRHRRKAA